MGNIFDSIVTTPNSKDTRRQDLHNKVRKTIKDMTGVELTNQDIVYLIKVVMINFDK